MRIRRVVMWPALALLPWTVLHLWPEWSLLIYQRTPGWGRLVLPNLIGGGALLLAGAGAASLLARLDLEGRIFAVLLTLGAFARIAMGYLGVGPLLLRSLLTVVLLGVAGRVAVTAWEEARQETGDGERTPRHRTWSAAKRALAVLVSAPYLLLAPLLFIYAAMGLWGGETQEYLLVLGIGSFWSLSLPALGIFYAVRPFRFGLPVLAILGLSPVVLVGWGWYEAEHDPEMLAEARSTAEWYVRDSAFADTMNLSALGKDRLSRHVGYALLDLAAEVDDDAFRERIAAGLGEVGEGREAEDYLWELQAETQGDSTRASLNGAARSAYRSVWVRQGMVRSMLSAMTGGTRLPGEWDGPR